MTRVRFGLQAVIVLGLFVLLSWPEQQQLRAVSPWRAEGPIASVRLPAGVDGGFGSGALRPETGYGGARAGGASGTSNLERRLYENPFEDGRGFVPPASVLALGGRINAIVGRAWTPLNSPIPFARLLLRNTLNGQVEARAIADGQGAFTFLDVVPSGYIVELLGADGAVIATSEFVPVALGDFKETLVRAAGGLAAFGDVAGTADEPVGLAASSGVTRVTEPETSISPQR